MLPATVLALLDHIDGLERMISLYLREIAEQRDYINSLHSLVLAWGVVIERCDGVVAAEQALLRYVAGVR